MNKINDDIIDLIKEKEKIQNNKTTCTQKILDFLSQNNEKAYSIKKLIEETGYTEYSIRKSLKKLIEIGLIDVIKVKGTNKKYYIFPMNVKGD